MRRSTLPFAPTKTYGPISVDLREKRREEKEKKSFSFSLHALNVVRPSTIDFFFFLIIIIIIWILDSYCLIRVLFCPEKNYLFTVHFILNELRLSQTFEIFVKISSLKSLTAYHLENRKNIPTVL